MLVKELESRLFARFPVSDAEPWDHVGLSVGDPEAQVAGVACALDPTPAHVEAAAARGANVLITHHPVYLKAPDTFSPAPGASTPMAAATVWAAVKSGVAILSFHTNLDRSVEARRCLAGLMGAVPVSSLEHPRDPEVPGLGALIDTHPVLLDDLAGRAATAFMSVPRIWRASDEPVTRYALLGGSLGDAGAYALAAGAGAVICGETGYHVCQDLTARGCSVILIGHDASELPFASVLAACAREAGVPAEQVSILNEHRQWRSYREEEIR